MLPSNAEACFLIGLLWTRAIPCLWHLQGSLEPFWFLVYVSIKVHSAAVEHRSWADPRGTQRWQSNHAVSPGAGAAGLPSVSGEKCRLQVLSLFFPWHLKTRVGTKWGIVNYKKKAIFSAILLLVHSLQSAVYLKVLINILDLFALSMCGRERIRPETVKLSHVCQGLHSRAPRWGGINPRNQWSKP